MHLRYTLGAIISLPLLPILYYQGKKIQASIPKLPEAAGPEGLVEITDTARTLKMIAIGESTIAGVGARTHEEAFTGTLARELARHFNSNVQWSVYARSGYTARRVTHKLLPRIREDDLDLIVIGLGGNDAFALHSPGRWRRDIIRLISALRTKFPETLIVFSNMPPIKEFPAFTPLIKFTAGNLVEILGDELRRLVRDNENVFYYQDKITLKGWTKRLNMDANRADYFSDGVHPSLLTYQTWAKELARVIYEEDVPRRGLSKFISS